MKFKGLLAGLSAFVSVSLLATAPVANAVENGSNPSITIPYKEYEELKKLVEAKENKQYWNMTFEQILEEEKHNFKKAWELYDFHVLRNIYLDSQVSGGSVDKLIYEMNVLNEISNTKSINMIIDSPGGSVFSGFNLYNAMMDIEAPINTVCDGMAASMAAVILSAGDHRVANDGCVFLIHEMAGGAPGGQTTQQIKTVDWYMTIENVLTEILSENTGFTMQDIRTLWEFETFWNANEILALGFVDEVVSNKPRDLEPGSRVIPDYLLPKNHVKNNLNERLQ